MEVTQDIVNDQLPFTVGVPGMNHFIRIGNKHLDARNAGTNTFGELVVDHLAMDFLKVGLNRKLLRQHGQGLDTPGKSELRAVMFAIHQRKQMPLGADDDVVADVLAKLAFGDALAQHQSQSVGNVPPHGGLLSNHQDF